MDCYLLKNNFYLKKILLFLVLLGILAVPVVSLAQGGSSVIIELRNPVNASTFEEMMGNIIDFLLYIAIAVAPVMIIIAGLLFITAGGSSGQITKAKNIITWTIIGFSIILLSKGLITVIKTLLKA